MHSCAQEEVGAGCRHLKIESASDGFVIDCVAVQSIEICGAICRQMYDFGINDNRFTEPCCFLHDARIALGPVGAVTMRG